MRYPLLKIIAASVGVAACTVSCSNAPRANTLIFDTHTVIAFDVSQEPTGNLGMTLGYRRRESIWLPLLPNTASASDQTTQAACKSDSCKAFVATTGNSSETGGTDARDTYSVLASFSDQSSGGSPVAASEAGMTGGTALTQYIATGFAARALAENGSVGANARVSTPDPGVASTRKRGVNGEPGSGTRKLEQTFNGPAPNR